jgi:hypothetical protein
MFVSVGWIYSLVTLRANIIIRYNKAMVLKTSDEELEGEILAYLTLLNFNPIEAKDERMKE